MVSSSDCCESRSKVTKKTREHRGAGSRRIFSPVFKLQVLDSYRRDADCQGNQRATARKYGIHRRQIQKWLQMETALRLSVQSSAALNLTKREPEAEEFVNVDEISDSEDDTSSCSSYGDQALDLSCVSKRRFYSADFKARVLEAFRQDRSCCGNQRATARKFGIHRRQVQKWLNQEAATTLETSKLADEPSKSEAYEEVQESALCLVKRTERLAKPESHFHRTLYPSATALEHPYDGLPAHLKPEYPCVYQPWQCCYQQILSARNSFETVSMFGPTSKRSSYAFNVKYEASYVDIPVQYGFGDVPPKWLKENPLFLHGPPSLYPYP